MSAKKQIGILDIIQTAATIANTNEVRKLREQIDRNEANRAFEIKKQAHEVQKSANRVSEMEIVKTNHARQQAHLADPSIKEELLIHKFGYDTNDRANYFEFVSSWGIISEAQAALIDRLGVFLRDTGEYDPEVEDSYIVLDYSLDPVNDGLLTLVIGSMEGELPIFYKVVTKWLSEQTS